MQTFLPLPSISESVKCLDYRCLGNQRSEARGVLRSLAYGQTWRNHPLVLMWEGYELALSKYMNCCIDEWKRRGYRNTMVKVALNGLEITYPPWFGDNKFHMSHRSNLLRKDPEWYGQFNWNDPIDLPYHWPVRRKNG